VLDTYNSGDVIEGKVTKVVAFGAFVEIVPGVEGLVHISELAEHHVESPSEVVSPGDEVRIKILEIDEERRRISLSIKRVNGQGLPPLRDTQAPEQAAPAEPPPEDVPDLGLSEEVFSDPSPEVPSREEQEPPGEPSRTDD